MDGWGPGLWRADGGSTLVGSCMRTSTTVCQQPDPIYVIELANVIAMAWAGSTAIELRMDHKLRGKRTISTPQEFRKYPNAFRQDKLGCRVVARGTIHGPHVVTSSEFRRYNGNSNSNNNNIANTTVDRRKTKIE